MIDVKRIKTSQLNEFINSSGYAEWEIVPISKHRAKSYINNPRSHSSDVVIYLAYLDDKFVGYRTILPDEVLVSNEKIRVGWLSGNWVHPKHRREGISTKLFNAAYNDWGGKMLYTNYAPESKSVYDKTSRFTLVNSCLGRRLYLRPSLRVLLPPKGRFFKLLLPLWFIVDFIFSVINPLPFMAKHICLGKNVSLEYLPKPDNELLNVFSELASKTLTQRSNKELMWITDYPWLVSSPLGDRVGERYFFSSAPKRFEQFLVKVYVKGRFAGFFIGNLNGRMFSVPYVYYLNEDHARIFSKIILKHAGRLNAIYLTVHDKGIANSLKGLFPFGMLSLSQKRNFFATFGMCKLIKNDTNRFLEGDGDSVFI